MISRDSLVVEFEKLDLAVSGPESGREHDDPRSRAISRDKAPLTRPHGKSVKLPKHLSDGLPTTLRTTFHRRQRRRRSTVCSPQKASWKEQTYSLLFLLRRPYVRFILCSAARTLQRFLDNVLWPPKEPKQLVEAPISLYVTIWR